MMNLADLAGLANQVCPMHVIIDPEGKVVSHGPTLHKVCRGESWIGKPVFEVLDLQRPRSVKSISDLMAVEGTKLHFQLRAEPHTRLKGVLVPLPSGHGKPSRVGRCLCSRSNRALRSPFYCAW